MTYLGQMPGYKTEQLDQEPWTACSDSPLYKLPPGVDPSNEIAEVLVKSLEWNMLSREWNLNVGDLSYLQLQSKDLL